MLKKIKKMVIFNFLFKEKFLLFFFVYGRINFFNEKYKKLLV